MKTINTILFLALSGIGMAGCNSSHDHGAENDTQGSLHLTLDNDKKWTANQETQVGFEKIRDRLKSFTTQKESTLSDYNNLGKELQIMIDNVVQQCTMKGQSHEELHKLLVPVIGNIKDLKGDDLGSCQDAVEELKLLAATYFEFFKV